MTCSTCQHWKATHEGASCTWGTCQRLEYANLQIGTVTIKAVVPSAGEALDGPGYSRFWTPDTFGCVLWEERGT